MATSAAAIDDLRGLAPPEGTAEIPPKHEDPIQTEEDALSAELAALDALLTRTTQILAGQGVPPATTGQLDLIALADRDLLAEWRMTLISKASESPVLAAARAGAALDSLAPLPNQA